MHGKVNRVSDFDGARLFERGDIEVDPNNFRTVVAVELFDSLAWVARDLPKRINRVREHARQDLYPIVRRAGLVGG
jgi:hypothetical protein